MAQAYISNGNLEKRLQKTAGTGKEPASKENGEPDMKATELARRVDELEYALSKTLRRIDEMKGGNAAWRKRQERETRLFKKNYATNGIYSEKQQAFLTWCYTVEPTLTLEELGIVADPGMTCVQMRAMRDKILLERRERYGEEAGDIQAGSRTGAADEGAD